MKHNRKTGYAIAAGARFALAAAFAAFACCGSVLADDGNAGLSQSNKPVELIPGLWFPVPEGYVQLPDNHESFSAKKSSLRSDGFIMKGCFVPKGQSLDSDLDEAILVCTLTAFESALGIDAKTAMNAMAIASADGSAQAQFDMIAQRINQNLMDGSIKLKLLPGNRKGSDALEISLVAIVEKGGETNNCQLVSKRLVRIGESLFCLVVPSSQSSESAAEKADAEYQRFLAELERTIRKCTVEHEGSKVECETPDKNPFVLSNRFTPLMFDSSSPKDVADEMVNRIVKGAVIDFLVILAVFVLLKCLARRREQSARNRPVPSQVLFVEACLIATFATSVFALTLSGGKAAIWFCLAVIISKPLFAVSIWKHHVWPRRFFLIVGILALAAGILERCTTPDGTWNELAVTSVYNGLGNLFMYALLASGGAEAWRIRLGESGKTDVHSNDA